MTDMPETRALVRTVHDGMLDCPWSHERVAARVCERCERLLGFEYRGAELVVLCRCPQSDAVNDPAWHGCV